MVRFRNLVFEGGGVKGIAYVGALEELKRRGVLGDVENVGGASAGSIVALLLALGYSNKEIKDVMSETDFNEFSDNDVGFVFDVLRLIRKFGWNKGKSFYSWVGDIVEAKTGDAGSTFRDVYRLRKKKGFLNLYVVGSNLSRGASEVYSYESSPDMEIRDALRISMSIPFYFQAVSRKGDVFVDGGVTLNYPINMFDNRKYLRDKKNGRRVSYSKDKDFVFNFETLGFRLDSEEEIAYSRKGWKSVPRKILNLKDYSLALVDFVSEVANKRHLHESDWNRTIFIDTLGVKTTDFDISEEKVKALVGSGIVGVRNYFKWLNSNSNS